MPPCTPHPGGTMQRRIITIISAVAVAAAITGLIVWLSQPSYDDIANDCVAALKERAEGNKSKPEACEGLKEDDYMALVISQAFNDLPQKDQNLLDYYDDGSINDSIGE